MNFRAARLLDSDFFGDSQGRNQREGRKEGRKEGRRDEVGGIRAEMCFCRRHPTSLGNLCRGDRRGRRHAIHAHALNVQMTHLTVCPPKKVIMFDLFQVFVIIMIIYISYSMNSVRLIACWMRTRILFFFTSTAQTRLRP